MSLLTDALKRAGTTEEAAISASAPPSIANTATVGDTPSTIPATEAHKQNSWSQTDLSLIKALRRFLAAAALSGTAVAGYSALFTDTARNGEAPRQLTNTEALPLRTRDADNTFHFSWKSRSTASDESNSNRPQSVPLPNAGAAKSSLGKNEISINHREIEEKHSPPAIAELHDRADSANLSIQQTREANPIDPAIEVIFQNGLPDTCDFSKIESRLHTSIAEQPNNASLHFLLGNLFAKQQRWPEAKDAYTKAVAANGGNPDYLFNLAVALDHLRRPAHAAEGYREALRTATHHPAGFSAERALQRLRELTKQP